MPKRAIESGVVDFVVPLKNIPQKIYQIVEDIGKANTRGKAIVSAAARKVSGEAI